MPGDHVCCVVGGGNPLHPLAAGWANDGFAAGDRVVVFDRGDRLAALDLDSPDIGRLDPREAFLGGGAFDPEPMLAAFRREAAAAPAEGRTLRVVANMDIDLAGMDAVASVARAQLGTRIELESPSSVLRRCWHLLGYDDRLPNVELRP